MAGIVLAIAEAIAAKVAEYSVEPALRQLRYIFCFNSIVKDLKKETSELKEVQEQVQEDVKRAKGDAEEIRKNVSKWLTEAQATIDEVQSLENEVQEMKSCFNGWCPNWCCRYQLSKKVTKKISVTVKLQKDGQFPKVGDPAPLPCTEIILSKDIMRSTPAELAAHQIMEALNNDDVTIVGLYGMGGVGKTTLVKEIGRKAEESKHFNKFVMPVVSQNPNLKNIQSQIAEALRLELKETTEANRASRLMVKLQNENKILIILDDVWNRLELDKLGIPLGKGCKILLTTRRRHVCAEMGCQKQVQLSILDGDEAWALFKTNAGLENDSSTLIDVAEKVAQECKGLPLAIVTVGRCLKGKAEAEWKEALQRLKNSTFVNVDDVDKEKEIYPCLKLSYDYLKEERTRTSFLLCSLFPEDFEIPIEHLARIGWGLGLFEEYPSFEDARSAMKAMMDTLQGSGLLLDIDEDGFVKLHDVVRDTALWIASEGENKFMVRTSDGLNLRPHDKSFEHYTAISLKGDNVIKEIPDGLVCPNLNTLMMEGDGYGDIMPFSDTFFVEMKALKVLRIQECGLSSQSLQSLTNLRALHLQFCEVDGLSSVGKLSKLEILSIWGSNITELPDEIGELNNLKLLELRYCDQLKQISPEMISKLSKLEAFSIEGCDGLYSEAEGTDGDRQNEMLIRELNLLSRLASLSLCVTRIPVDFIFQKLSRFEITKGRRYAKIDLGILERTTPVVNKCEVVRSLRLEDIDALSLNAFKELFPTVQNLHLTRSTGFQNIIPELDRGGMKELMYLAIRKCEKMERVFDLTHGHHSPSNLIYLFLSELPELKYIWKWPRQDVKLRSLTAVKLDECHKLTSLFSTSIARSLVQLQSLYISRCEGLEQIVVLENEEGEISSQSHLHCFPKLTRVDIEGCDKLECSFPVSIAQGLLLLEELSIRSCYNLKQVFGHERAREVFVGDTNHIELPKLRSLELRRLNNLPCFCQSDYHQMFSSLRGLTVMNCPKFRITFIQEISSLPNLSFITIEGCNELKSLFPTQISSFPKLSFIDVEGCNKLKSLFPIIISTSFPNLVEGSSQSEEVFKHENVDEEHVTDEKKIELDQLRFLNLQNLPSLVNFCPRGNDFFFPSVDVLKVSHCPNITTIFSIDTNNHVHAKAQLKAPQLVKRGVAEEGTSTTQAITTTRSLGNGFYWFKFETSNNLPQYMEESISEHSSTYG